MVARVPGQPSPAIAQREPAEGARSFPHRSHEESLELGQLGSVPIPRHAGEAFLRGRDVVGCHTPGAGHGPLYQPGRRGSSSRA